MSMGTGTGTGTGAGAGAGAGMGMAAVRVGDESSAFRSWIDPRPYHTSHLSMSSPAHAHARPHARTPTCRRTLPFRGPALVPFPSPMGVPSMHDDDFHRLYHHRSSFLCKTCRWGGRRLRPPGCDARESTKHAWESTKHVQSNASTSAVKPSGYSARANPAPPGSCGPSHWRNNTKMQCGTGHHFVASATAGDCCDACQTSAGCTHWVWTGSGPRNCHIKTGSVRQLRH